MMFFQSSSLGSRFKILAGEKHGLNQGLSTLPDQDEFSHRCKRAEG